jgi:hypothetical protein
MILKMDSTGATNTRPSYGRKEPKLSHTILTQEDRNTNHLNHIR